MRIVLSRVEGKGCENVRYFGRGYLIVGSRVPRGDSGLNRGGVSNISRIVCFLVRLMIMVKYLIIIKRNTK